MIKWKEEYSLGIEIIDEQHQKLFEIAGRAYEIMKDQFSIDKYDDIIAIIDELKEYAVYHFQSEEAYMQGISYRKFLSHKVMHDDFVQKINQIDLRQVDENPEKNLLQVLDFIVAWIGEHILVQDKAYTTV